MDKLWQTAGIWSYSGVCQFIDRWPQESHADGSTTFAAPAQAAKIGLARIWHSKQILGTETGWWFQGLWKIFVNGKDYPWLSHIFWNKTCSKPPIRRGLVIPNFLLRGRYMKQWSKISALGFGEMHSLLQAPWRWTWRWFPNKNTIYSGWLPIGAAAKTRVPTRNSACFKRLLQYDLTSAGILSDMKLSPKKGFLSVSLRIRQTKSSTDFFNGHCSCMWITGRVAARCFRSRADFQLLVAKGASLSRLAQSQPFGHTFPDEKHKGMLQMEVRKRIEKSIEIPTDSWMILGYPLVISYSLLLKMAQSN